MTFSLGRNSRAELIGVDTRLVRIVERAIARSPVDFTVNDGIRTVAEQKRYVAEGVSWTMKSKHLEGRAVDLVPWINGKPRWEWPPIYRIAAIMREVAIEEGVTLRWGGVWDRNLNDLPASPSGLEGEVEAYVARQKAKSKRAAIDGPHYELVA